MNLKPAEERGRKVLALLCFGVGLFEVYLFFVF